jgi:hypothetical protein
LNSVQAVAILLLLASEYSPQPVLLAGGTREAPDTHPVPGFLAFISR